MEKRFGGHTVLGEKVSTERKFDSVDTFSPYCGNCRNVNACQRVVNAIFPCSLTKKVIVLSVLRGLSIMSTIKYYKMDIFNIM